MSQTGNGDGIERIDPQAASVMLRPADEEIDPYSADASFITTGKDPVYRFTRGRDGKIARVEQLTPEEVEAGRLPRKSKPAKRLRKGMGR